MLSAKIRAYLTTRFVIVTLQFFVWPSSDAIAAGAKNFLDQLRPGLSDSQVVAFLGKAKEDSADATKFVIAKPFVAQIEVRWVKDGSARKLKEAIAQFNPAIDAKELVTAKTEVESLGPITSAGAVGSIDWRFGLPKNGVRFRVSPDEHCALWSVTAPWKPARPLEPYETVRKHWLNALEAGSHLRSVKIPTQEAR